MKGFRTVRTLSNIDALVLIVFAGCDADSGAGIIKKFEDNQDGIRRELGELRDAFLEEANEWSESLNLENREE